MTDEEDEELEEAEPARESGEVLHSKILARRQTPKRRGRPSKRDKAAEHDPIDEIVDMLLPVILDRVRERLGLPLE